MKEKILVFVGMPGAGKSTLVEYLERKGIPSVYFGGITLDEVKRQGLEINPENEKRVREELREREGKDVYTPKELSKRLKLSLLLVTTLLLPMGYTAGQNIKFLRKNLVIMQSL